MRQIFILLLSLLPFTLSAESARSILDKAAKTVSNPGGVEAKFQMTSQQMGTTSGTIAVKGSKFHAVTPQAIVWFDGKTQWTYLKQNDEVNVSHPTEAQLQAINPYNFINLYKQGYQISAKAAGCTHEVHLKATSQKRGIQEMTITVDKKTYRPTQVKMLQNGKWVTITISSLKTATISDSKFQFNAKDYPQAEIIDLR